MNTGSSVLSLLMSVVIIYSAAGQDHTRQIPTRSCVVSQDTSSCYQFGPKTYTVGRDVESLGNLYRMCLSVDSVISESKPVRVVLALDRSSSMCRFATNDPNDTRILAAHQFVDSLASRSPESQVGIMPFWTEGEPYEMLTLDNPANIRQLHEWITTAACNQSGDDYLGKQQKTAATFTGIALLHALEFLDLEPPATGDRDRHIVFLTDDEWDADPNNPMDQTPQGILNAYTSGGGVLPRIHGIYLTAEGTDPQGTELEYVTQQSNGIYVPNATPATMVAELLDLLGEIYVEQYERPVSLTATNLGSGDSESGNFSTIDESANVWLAVGDQISLIEDTSRIEIYLETNMSERRDTITVIRTNTPGTGTPGGGVTTSCSPDTLHMRFDATPAFVYANEFTSVTAAAERVDRRRFHPGVNAVVIRVPYPEAPSMTTALLHLDGNADIEGPDASVSGESGLQYTASNALFDSSLSGGSISIASGSLPDVFTMECWIRLDNGTRNASVFTAGDFGLDIRDRRLRFSTPNDTVLGHGTLDRECWQHIAVVRENDNTITLYVNGRKDSPSITDPTTVPGTITIGEVDGYLLDEVRFSNAFDTEQVEGVTVLQLPSLENTRWIQGTDTLTQRTMSLREADWIRDSVTFQYALPSPVSSIAQMIHDGPDDFEWAKSASPVEFGYYGSSGTATFRDTSGDGYIDAIDIHLGINEVGDSLPEGLVESITMTTLDGQNKQWTVDTMFAAETNVLRITVLQSYDGVFETGWETAEITLNEVPVTSGGLPVTITEVFDGAGPVVQKAVHHPALRDDENDTLFVTLSEPVRTDSLNTLPPGRCFRYYKGVQGYLDTALDNSRFPEWTDEYVRSFIIELGNPEFEVTVYEDSLQLTVHGIDRAGNEPPGHREGHRQVIEPGGGNRIQIGVAPSIFRPGDNSIRNRLGPSTYRIYEEAIGDNTSGTLIVVNSIKRLKPDGTSPDGRQAYGTAVVFDAVGNVVTDDLALVRTGRNDSYATFWNGKNRNGRTVGTGAYLIRISAQDESGTTVTEAIKVGVREVGE